tara:strand:- start:2630 stop:4516 length:1887 start_codon:yes stop_codon:yes gene_type:complete
MGLKNLLSNLDRGKPINPASSPSYPYHNDFGNDKSTSIFDNPTFNQKSIGFEDEEPFIKGGINLGGTNTFNSITGGFIRGGALMHAERSIQDINRIGKFFVSNRGITFLAKQIGLQKSNPKISKPAFNNSNANHRTYNFGINTLAQVVGQGTGLHVNRQGLTPFAKEGYKDEEKFYNNYEKGKNTNKLLFLYDNHITRPKAEAEADKTGIAGFFQNVKKFFAKPGEELYSYQGGPGSTYGIGQTRIQKYSLTQAFEDLGVESHFGFEDKIPLFSVSSIIKKNKLTDQDLSDLNNLTSFQKQATNSDKHYLKFNDHILNGKTRVKNYLATLKPKKFDDYTKNGKSFHREERINLGNPGADPSSNTTVDLINALDIFNSDGSALDSNGIKDLIRFRIEAVDPYNPTSSNVMVFRAFLDSLNDNFNANYNEFNYNGRAESFYTYNSFNRSISFSFKIAAQSKREMRPLYRKLNYLLSNTAPEYHETSGRMMTPFMRLTLGSYFDRLPGVMTNVGITWQKDYSWEINLENNMGGLYILPHVLDVSVTYQPIHDFLPQKSEQSPFIIPHKESPISNTPLKKSFNSDPSKKSLFIAELEAEYGSDEDGVLTSIKPIEIKPISLMTTKPFSGTQP